MTLASDKFNALPFEVRNITLGADLEHHLRDLRIERDRAVKHHKAHLREIDAHIENIERELERWERDHSAEGK